MTLNYLQEKSAQLRADLIVEAVDEARDVLRQVNLDPPLDPGGIDDEAAPWTKPYIALLGLLGRSAASLSEDDVETALQSCLDIHAWVATQRESAEVAE